jgi:sugar O-acyltransferase (sialic acid O-acetyltransferase NeuD family)
MLLAAGGFDIAGLIDDEPENANRHVGELSVVGSRADLAALRTDGVEGVVLGFGAVAGRDEVIAAIRAAGLSLPVLLHPLAHLSSSSTVAAGAQVLVHASVGPGAQIGFGVLINTGAIVEHDVVVAECAVVGPGAVLTGRTRICGSVEIGAGAVVLPDTRIGPHAVVGAGAVVTREVCEGQTVVGVPARPVV